MTTDIERALREAAARVDPAELPDLDGQLR